MNRLTTSRTLQAVRRNGGVFGSAAVTVAVLLLSLAAPARANDEAAYSQTWTQGDPVLEGSGNPYYPQGTPIYPVCVEGEVDLFAYYSGFTWLSVAGLYPSVEIFSYSNCILHTTPVSGVYPMNTVGAPVPAGQLLIYRDLFWWDGGTWQSCVSDSDWISSSATAFAMSILGPGTTQYTTASLASSTGSNTMARYTPAAGSLGPCGSGYYNLGAVTYAWTGTQWLGGTVFSGNVYIN